MILHAAADVRAAPPVPAVEHVLAPRIAKNFRGLVWVTPFASVTAISPSSIRRRQASGAELFERRTKLCVRLWPLWLISVSSPPATIAREAVSVVLHLM